MAGQDAPPTPRAPLLRHGAAGVVVVVVAALAFWGIGSVRDDTPPVAVEDTPPTEPDDGDDDAEPDDVDDGEDDAEEDGADDPPEDADGDDPPPDDDGEDDPTDDGDADDGEDGDDADEPPAVDPTDVTIQVLDGYKSDGGAAADVVAAALADAGYQVIARNDALNYDVTTILYNPGNEDAAQQVADEIGAPEVREQPGTLSSAVSLHVVVGSDRA